MTFDAWLMKEYHHNLGTHQETQGCPYTYGAASGIIALEKLLRHAVDSGQITLPPNND